MKPKLVTRPPDRFFAFGCSFTNYDWLTWPEPIAADLDITQYYNLGMPGAGNELIFNRLMQVDSRFGLGPSDLVMICWSSICREDRFVDRHWLSPGNIYSQSIYPADFVERYFSDPASVSLHDFAFIRASRVLLEARGCQFHFIQMLDLSVFYDQWTCNKIEHRNELLELELRTILPSFYHVLWDDDIEKRHVIEKQLYGSFNGHPGPAEHLRYLETVFDHKWKELTVSSVNFLEDGYQIARKQGLKGINNFRRLRQPLPAKGIY